MQTEVVSIEQRDGYEIRHEWVWQDGQENEKVMLNNAYTPTGEYIGGPRMAFYLIVVLGIRPEYRTEHSNVCTVGYSAKHEKWFGWSHRAICGFGIGDKLFDAEWPGGNDNTPFYQHGDITIDSFERARQAACNFAEYV